MDWLPESLDAWGPAALAAVLLAGYLVLGEPVAGYVLHRRFEGRLQRDPAARRSFYRRLLVLEWGLAVIAAIVWAAAPGVGPAAVGLAWPRSWPGPVTGAAVVLVLVFLLVSLRAMASGALRAASEQLPRRPGDGRHAEPGVHATLALLPRTRGERRLFTVVGLTAGLCEEWLYRAFFLAVVSALLGAPPLWVLVLVAAAAFGLAHAYQGVAGIVTTAVLGAVLAALYLETGSVLLPVLLHAAIDLRFLLVPASVLPPPTRSPA
ncbi:CPBP family intramembrane glutamic endopeptidase [Geodermatophilus sp. SYSU D00815]